MVGLLLLATKREKPHQTKTKKTELSKPKVQASPTNKPPTYELNSLSESDDIKSDEEIALVKNNLPLKGTQNLKNKIVKKVPMPINNPVPRKASQASKQSEDHQIEENEPRKSIVPIKKPKTQTVIQTNKVQPKPQIKVNPKFEKMRQALLEFQEEEEQESEEQEIEEKIRGQDPSEKDQEQEEQLIEVSKSQNKKSPKQIHPNITTPTNNKNLPQSTEFDVIVSGLPYTATENDIKNHFKNCKNILNIKIMINQTGQSNGKAFIKFSHHNDINKALKMNNSQLNDRILTVEQTHPRNPQSNDNNQIFGNQQISANLGNEPGTIPQSNNVIVRNLSFTIDEERLRNHFSVCGKIKGVKIMLNEEGRNKGFGFVDFYNPDSARSALKKNGEKLDGRTLNIELSIPRSPRGYQGKSGQGGFDERGGHSNFGNERRGFITKFGGEEVNLG